MEKEIWKSVKGYEGWYEVSNFGRVRGLERMETLSDGRKRLRKGRILKLKKNRYGYFNCYLYKNSKPKTITIHRLVAQAFIPNPNNLPQVNHKDEVKTNNCVFLNKDGSVDLKKSNLEWCDAKYNVNYGTAKQRRLIKLSKPVLQIDKDTNEVIAEYPSAMEAARKLNIFQVHISKCCNGKRKTAYGYKWRYKED